MTVLPTPPFGEKTVMTRPSAVDVRREDGAMPPRVAASWQVFLIVKTRASVSCGSITTSEMPALSASCSSAPAPPDVTRMIGAAVACRIASISEVGRRSPRAVPCRITCAPLEASFWSALPGSTAVPTISISGWACRACRTSARPAQAPVMKVLMGDPSVIVSLPGRAA